jgi:hypothetical protein
MSKILEEVNHDFPFKWANLDSYRDSKSFRKEIYLVEEDNKIENLIMLFYTLFQDSKPNLIVYNKSWWDFCLDTWDINNDQYNYEVEGKSKGTQQYLRMLHDSQLPISYSGCCSCKDWDVFLASILRCIVDHTAPYSPLICDSENNFFFYFHYSGSIGIYYEEQNTVVEKILFTAGKEYNLSD